MYKDKNKNPADSNESAGFSNIGGRGDSRETDTCRDLQKTARCSSLIFLFCKITQFWGKICKNRLFFTYF